ncbi:MAG: DUF554 domain-containing protein [Firmicutes bacterium]|nr:DUF554 domain-containing protein [Bacillota bacterium]
MPLGVFVNVISVVLGALTGSLISDHLPDSLKKTMTTVFGFCAMGMGIISIVKIKNMPAVIFAVIIGTLIGTLLNLDGAIRKGTQKAVGALNLSLGEDTGLMITAIVLFCASGTGIYGSLISGMTGDNSILFSKSVLDFFTSMIFACQLKKALMLVGIPQLIVFLILFFSAKLIFPLTNESMIADFQSVGGFVLLATGFSIMKVKEFPVANMIPAMILAMPLSALWMLIE